MFKLIKLLAILVVQLLWKYLEFRKKNNLNTQNEEY
jgi:hypothetical protein